MKYINKRGCFTEVKNFPDLKSAVSFAEEREINSFFLQVEKDI